MVVGSTWSVICQAKASDRLYPQVARLGPLRNTAEASRRQPAGTGPEYRATSSGGTVKNQNSAAAQRFDFAGQLLGGVILVMLTLAALALIVFLLPARHAEAPGRAAAAVVVAESNFPVGSSRVVNWGERIILVVRHGDRAYYAVQGTSPTDGCILDWDAESSRVISPCSYLAFDVHGNAIAGLSSQPLRRYAVFVRNDVVYVTDI
jgi:nitrite reductase/ring-hydroxylating ferredoxin subunit